MTVVVHSVVGVSSLLYCCDLVVFFCFLFSTLCLQVGNRLGFWGGFSCFVSFIWCQLFACLIRAAIFRLPPAFVVWSFFPCHRHLWSVLFFFATCICVQSLSFTAFSAVGIRVRLFVFTLLALVSGYQCISQFLLSCCAACCFSASSLEIRTGIFPSRLLCGQPYKFRFEANPIWYSAIKFTKSDSAKCSLHKWAWLRRSSQFVWTAQILPIFASQRVDSAGTRAYSYALGCLWVVTVCCNTVGRHG